jgi:hypothetical protein
MRWLYVTVSYQAADVKCIEWYMLVQAQTPTLYVAQHEHLLIMFIIPAHNYAITTAVRDLDSELQTYQ